MKRSILPRAARRAAAGFTLVEIMIALLIGLVAVIVIMQTYAVSEGFKRTSSGGSDAQTNGGIALYLIERETRIAGYGLNAMATQCPTLAVYSASTGRTTTIPVFPPIQLNPAGVAAGDANTDVLLIAYGTSDGFIVPVGASQPGGSATSDFVISQNFNAVRSGDLLVTYTAGGALSGNSCILTEATAVPYAAGNCNGAAGSGVWNTVSHGTGAYSNSYRSCASVTPQHNPAGGVVDPRTGAVAAALAGSGWLYDLGGSPQIKAYAVRNGNLTVCDMLTSDCSDPAGFLTVMSDIVSLRVVLGHDSTGPSGTPDGVIDSWRRTNGTTGTDNILAVAVQLTARTPLREKSSGGSVDPAACDTTIDKAKPDRTQNWFGPSLPSDDGSAAASQIDLSRIADWKCYRYKMFQTTVPVRNAIWTP